MAPSVPARSQIVSALSDTDTNGTDAGETTVAAADDDDDAAAAGGRAADDGSSATGGKPSEGGSINCSGCSENCVALTNVPVLALCAVTVRKKLGATAT